MNYYKALILSDIHVPFQDQKVFDSIIYPLCKDEEKLSPFDEIISLGDFLDMWNMSLHPKLPEAVNLDVSILDEIHEGRKLFKKFNDMFPNAKKTLIKGNHCYRLERFVQKQCPNMFDMFSIKEMFLLDEYNWSLIEYGKTQLYKIGESDMYCRHEPYSGSSAKASVNKGGVSLIWGHTHRLEYFKTRRVDGTEIVGCGLGWLGNRSSKAFSYIKGADSWSQAFGIVHVIDGHAHLEIIEIVNNKGTKQVVRNGFIYTT